MVSIPDTKSYRILAMLISYIEKMVHMSIAVTNSPFQQLQIPQISILEKS